MRLALLALAPLAVAACNGDGGSGPGAVSEGEAQALDEAAEMLDARQLPPEALPPLPGNDEGEAEEAPELTGDEAQ